MNIAQQLLESEVMILRADKERFQQHNTELVLKRQEAEQALAVAEDTVKRQLTVGVHALQQDSRSGTPQWTDGWNAAIRQVLEILK